MQDMSFTFLAWEETADQMKQVNKWSNSLFSHTFTFSYIAAHKQAKISLDFTLLYKINLSIKGLRELTDEDKQIFYYFSI